MDTFTWTNFSPGAQNKIAFRALSAQFGDGYKQSADDGLNCTDIQWPLTFVGTEAELQPIYNFIMAHKGSQSFYWKAPFGSATDMWKIDTQQTFQLTSIGAGIYQIDVQFNSDYQVQ